VTPVNPSRKLDRYEKILIVLFAVSLPLVNPWVRGDGVGYYAYARALVINHNLRFEQDWQNANPSFRGGRLDADGRIRADQYTSTGYLDNHFTIGPALIWIPFLEAAHLAVLCADHFGANIPPTGYSWPYLDTMAVVTALAGFLGLFISFRLARKYFPERWAFAATLGIWFASSLPVYMYFNPSWSHAQSAFMVAIFLWYWDYTREARAPRQWFLLGLISGLMIDMYYPNALFLLAFAVECYAGLGEWVRSTLQPVRAKEVFEKCSLFAVALLLAFSPTLITRRIIYGGIFRTGYTGSGLWHFKAPLWGRVLFSTDHGLFSWTPVLILACVGLAFLFLRDRRIGTAAIVSLIAFYYLISSYQNWDGISSFGNRFFISLTPIFVLGLAAMLTAFERVWRSRTAVVSSAVGVLTLLTVWNCGLIFQWGMHLIPERGTFSWSEMAANQFLIVPEGISDSIARYFTARHALMQNIEKKDLHQLGEADPSQGKPSRKQ